MRVRHRKADRARSDASFHSGGFAFFSDTLLGRCAGSLCLAGIYHVAVRTHFPTRLQAFVIRASELGRVQ